MKEIRFLIPIFVSLLFLCCTEEKVGEYEVVIPEWLDGTWYSAEDGTGDDIFEEIPFGNQSNPRFEKREWNFDIANNTLNDIWYPNGSDGNAVKHAVYTIQWLSTDKYRYPQKVSSDGYITPVPAEYDTPYLDYMSYGIFTDVSTGKSYTLRIWKVEGVDNIAHFVIGPCDSAYRPLKNFMFLSDEDNLKEMACAILRKPSISEISVDNNAIQVFNRLEIRKYNLKTHATNIELKTDEFYSFQTEEDNILLNKYLPCKNGYDLSQTYCFKVSNIRGLDIELERYDTVGVKLTDEIFKTRLK